MSSVRACDVIAINLIKEAAAERYISAHELPSGSHQGEEAIDSS